MGLIALSLSLHAQSRIEINGKDTLACIPIEQLRTANAKFIDLAACWEIRDSLYWQMDDYEWLVESQNLQIQDLTTVNKLNQKIINDKVNIIALQDKQIASGERKIKWLKTQRWVLFGAVLLLTGKIIL